MRVPFVGTRLSGFAVALTASLALVHAGVHAEKAAEEYTETIDLSFPLNADGEFVLGNTNGAFTLSTWDKNEVRIVAEKRMRLDEGAVSWLWRLLGLKVADIGSDEDARKVFEQLAVEVTGDEQRREVKTIYPETSGGIDFNVTYTVTAPHGVNVSVDTTNGAIRIDDVAGRVGAESTNGSIVLDDVVGETEARTTNGRIEIEDSGGWVTARTTNGSIQIGLRRNLDAIHSIHARSVNGSVSLSVPEGTDFDFHGRTMHGSVACDFELEDARAETRRELEGRSGAGGPRVELQATNGSVKVTKLD